jgi:Phage integrase family/HNH endonuclease
MSAVIDLATRRKAQPISENGKVRPPRRRKNAETRSREHLTPDEVAALIKAARSSGRYGQRDATLIEIVYRHGLRVSEATALRWEQIELKQGLLHVRRLKNGTPSTQPLRGPELRALRGLQAEWPQSPYVFCSERGGPMTASNVRKMIARVGREAKLSFPGTLICCATDWGTSSPLKARTHGRSNSISVTSRSRTPPITPRCRPSGSSHFSKTEGGVALAHVATTPADIVEYWATRIDERDLPVDWTDALDHCWRCTDEERLQRCHIVPASRGGRDEPSNLVLLCTRCHRENPNVSDAAIMWQWIKQSIELRRKHLGAEAAACYGLYWTARAAEEYERLFGRRLRDDLHKMTATCEGVKAEYPRLSREAATTHLGDPWHNPSTAASLWRKALEQVEWMYE